MVSFKRLTGYNLSSGAIKQSTSTKIKSVWNDAGDSFDCLCYRRDYGIVKLSSELCFITISGPDSIANITYAI